MEVFGGVTEVEVKTFPENCPLAGIGGERYDEGFVDMEEGFG